MGRKKKKRKPGQRGVRALSPRYGVSSWVHKPMNVSRRMWLREQRKKFAFLSLPRAFRDSEAIRERGVDNLSRTEKKDFVKRNARVAARANEMDGIPASKIFKVISKHEAFDKLTNELLNGWVTKTCNAIRRAEAAGLQRKIQTHLLAYFKSRKIPVRTQTERDALGVTVDSLMIGKKITNFTRPLNLAWIEQYYLRCKRGFRSIDQEEAVDRNSLFREIFGRERLTPNQRREAKRWMLTNYPELKREKDKVRKDLFGGLTGIPDAKLFRKLFENYDKLEEAFKQRAKEDMIKMFKTEKENHAGKPVVKQAWAIKTGNRAERMAAYTLREKTSTEKRRGLLKEKLKALVESKPFDPVTHILKEIGLENRPTADFLERLIEKKLLKEDNLVKLFIKGSLTQRTFQRVVENEEFRTMFGTKHINALATGLTYIGPVGKLTERVKKAFQGEKGRKLFEFLERKGFIDTGHGKGKTVTYLARFDSLESR
jgi:hypothetical protein